MTEHRTAAADMLIICVLTMPLPLQTNLGIQTESPAIRVTFAMVQERVTERTMLITVQHSQHHTGSIMPAPHNGSASAQHLTVAVGTKWHSGGTAVAQWLT